MKGLILMTGILTILSVVGCEKKAPADAERASAQATPEHPSDEGADEHKADEHKPDKHEVAEHKVAEHGEDEHHSTGQSPTTLEDLPDGVNAVQHEMRLLNEAMLTTFQLIVNNQLSQIPPQIEKVHSARMLTDKAIEKGLYQRPKNADAMEGFEKLDHAFHDDLKGLLQASKKDDLAMATEKFGDIVQGCTTCHMQYRY